MQTSASRSSVYLAVGNIASKIVTGIGQALFGLLLEPAAFGVYAFVIGIVTVANIVRDGGISDHLVRLGPNVRANTIQEALAGAMATNTAAAIVLASSAQILFNQPEKSEVRLLLFLAASAMPLGSHLGIAVGVLQSRCEFKRAALLFFVQPATQTLSALILAVMLRTATSLVLGLVISTAISSAIGMRLAKLSLFPRLSAWRTGIRMVQQSKWLVAGSLGVALITTGDYLGLGLTWTEELLGTYFFGYQIPAQLGGIASSVGQVLLASLPRAANQHARRSLLRSGTLAVGYIVTPLCATVVIALPIAEDLIWRGRWDSAVVVGQVLAALFPLRLLLVIARSIRVASGEYRRWTIHIGIAGAGLFCISLLAGAMTKDLTVVAFITGIYLAIAVGIMASSALMTEGFSKTHTAEVVLTPYVVCALLALPFLAFANWGPEKIGITSATAAVQALALYWLLVIVVIRYLNPAIWQAIGAQIVPSALRRKVDTKVSNG